MCNLYRMTRTAAEIANLFSVASITNAATSSYVYPGSQGLVIEGDAVRAMTWGFPLPQKSKRTGEPIKPKPVNNTRTDKLDSSFWKASFRDRRCLIPVSAFAEAEGARGKMTRTWFGEPNEDTLVCAGLWRDSAKWGVVYSMVMTDANHVVGEVHNRMPVILAAHDLQQYAEGSEADAMALCQPFTGKLLADRTDEPWFRRNLP